MTPETQFLATVTSLLGTIETLATDPLDALIVTELRPDSLDMVELAMALEDEFGVSIADHELEPFDPMRGDNGKTLRDLFEVVRGKMERTEA